MQQLSNMRQQNQYQQALTQGQQQQNINAALQAKNLAAYNAILAKYAGMSPQQISQLAAAQKAAQGPGAVGPGNAPALGAAPSDTAAPAMGSEAQEDTGDAGTPTNMSTLAAMPNGGEFDIP
jgi:hypothetical protein